MSMNRVAGWRRERISLVLVLAGLGMSAGFISAVRHAVPSRRGGGAAPAGQRERPQAVLDTERPTRLRGALAVIDRAAQLPGGEFAVLSESSGGDDRDALDAFSASGVLVKAMGGTAVPLGLSRLTSLEATRGGNLLVTTFYPPEVGRFDQTGLVSARKLAPLKNTYGIALDEARGYAYIAGCRVVTDAAGPCLLVHQFSLRDWRLRRSFLPMAPSVRLGQQFSVQSVPLDVDSEGTVWAVDSPALVLYSINPATGLAVPHPIREIGARPAGRFNPLGSGDYVRNYLGRYTFPLGVAAAGGWVVVSLRRPGGRGYALAVFDRAGAEVAGDLRSPGPLVGRGPGGRLLFARSGRGGPGLVVGRLRVSR